MIVEEAGNISANIFCASSRVLCAYISSNNLSAIGERWLVVRQSVPLFYIRLREYGPAICKKQRVR